jgi:hypothetical protein
MSNLENMQRAQKRLENKLNKIYRATGIEIFNKLVKESPVDTGRFRGNWQAQINLPNLSILYDALPKGTQIPSPIINIPNSMTIYDKLYLTNNLPYAARLNNGWSKQAPIKFVESAVAAGNEALTKAISEVGK